MTIKETAGKILLYFYQLQRTVPLTMRYRQLGFINKKTGGVSLTSDKKWLTSNLLSINNAPTDILNAFMFLIDKGYVQSRERATADARIYVGIELTHAGVDMVEGIEHDAQADFTTTFHIPVSPGANVDSLINENLSQLIEQTREQ